MPLPVLQHKLLVYNRVAEPFRAAIRRGGDVFSLMAKFADKAEFKSLCMAFSDTILALAKNPKPKIDENEMNKALKVIGAPPALLTLAIHKARDIEKTLAAVTPVPENQVLRATLDLKLALEQKRLQDRNLSNNLAMEEALKGVHAALKDMDESQVKLAMQRSLTEMEKALTGMGEAMADTEESKVKMAIEEAVKSMQESQKNLEVSDKLVMQEALKDMEGALQGIQQSQFKLAKEARQFHDSLPAQVRRIPCLTDSNPT